VRGLLLACGIRPGALVARPTHDASANRAPHVTPTIVSLARAAESLRPGSLVPPKLGDVIVMHDYHPARDAGRVHLAVVVPHPPPAVARGATDGDGATYVRVTTVDGGERDGLGGRGPQLVARKMRIFHVEREGPPASINGPLSFAIDLCAFAARWGET
jgi:hypothetical protein